jgi:hypothetical protein
MCQNEDTSVDLVVSRLTEWLEYIRNTFNEEYFCLASSPEFVSKVPIYSEFWRLDANLTRALSDLYYYKYQSHNDCLTGSNPTTEKWCDACRNTKEAMEASEQQ